MKARHFLLVAVIIILFSIQSRFVYENSEKKTQSNFRSKNIIFTEQESIKTDQYKKPNIIFVVADDLGFNDVGYHGSEIKTPNIDKLALSGVTLENYYVQPVCTPTRGQLLTGRYQIHTGLNWVIWPATPTGLSLDHPTIADKLQKFGYSTHMVGKWHLGFYKPEYLPTNRGFDTFFGLLSGHSDHYTHETGNFQEKIMYGTDLMENDRPADITRYNGSYSTHLFANKVKEIIVKQDVNKPMFIYLSFQAVHAPLQVPDEYLAPYTNIQDPNRRIYAGMVSCMDEEIGNIVDVMKERNIWNNTIFIFSTDNGANPKVGGSNWPLKGTKSTLWEGGIRAVGFIHSPLLGIKGKGYRSKELMHVTDWFPTILNVATGRSCNFCNTDGIDQWETIKYGIPSKRKEILHNIDPVENNTYHTRRYSMRMGEWKIIIGQSDSGRNTEQCDSNLKLFNIESDPLEEENVCQQFPDIVKLMVKRLEYYESGMIKCRFPNIDEKADPILHDGFWQPWQ